MPNDNNSVRRKREACGAAVRPRAATKHLSRRVSLLAIAAASAVVAMPHYAIASSGTWTANAPGNWSDPNNWTGGTVPGATSGTTNTDTATFANTTGTTITIDSASQNIGNITFGSGAGADTIGGSGANGGNPLLLSSNGAITDSLAAANTELFDAPLVGYGTYTFANWSSSTGLLNFAGNITGAFLTLDGSNTGQNTISGAISSSALGKLGGGTWVLSGSNTYTGDTIVSGGTLSLTGSLSGSSTLLTGGASSLSYAPTANSGSGNTQSFNGALLGDYGSAGALTIEVSAGNTLALNGISRAVGETAVFSASGTITTSSSNAGSTGILGPWAAVSGSGTAGNNTAGGFTYATVSGGSIVPYTGAATSAGIAWPSAGSANTNYDILAGNSTSVSASHSANTLRYVGTTPSVEQSNANVTLTVNGIMNAGGGLYTIGGGANTLRVGIGSNNSGELVLAAETAGITIENGIFNNGTLTITGSNSNVVTLAGAGAYSGPTNIVGGTVNLAAPETPGTSGPLGSAGSIYLDGGILQFSSTDTYDYSGRFSNSLAEDYYIDTNGQAVTFASALRGFDSVLTKFGAGTLTLTGSNSYTGATTINAGTLRADSSDATGNGSVIIATGTSGYGGGRLGGNGTVLGTVALAGNANATWGGLITAGTNDSTNGILTTGAQTWNGGAAYQWKISSAGNPGALGSTTNTGGTPGTNWDELVMSGLTVSAGSGTAFTITPTGNVSVGIGNYNWVIADVTSSGNLSVNGSPVSLGTSLPLGSNQAFALDTSFLTVNNSAPIASEFSLEYISDGGSGGDLVLEYDAVPETRTCILVLSGGLAIVLSRHRRRQAVR